MNTIAPAKRQACTSGHPRNCRCNNCMELRREWERARHRHIGYGTWEPFTDAQPVREHLRSLMAAGATLRSIAAAADYDHGHVGRILWAADGEKPRARVGHETAARILAVTLDQVGISDFTPVDPTGTLRRLRALVATGRPVARIACDIGYSASAVQHILWEQSRVTSGFATRVATRYDELKNLDPETDGVPARYAAEARDRAKQHGWELPAAWDDDIDDPNAISNFNARHRARNTDEQRAWRAAQQEDARLLTVRGHTAEDIAARLGVTARTVVRWRTAGGWKAAA